MVDFRLRRPRPFDTHKHRGKCQRATTVHFFSLACLRDKKRDQLEMFSERKCFLRGNSELQQKRGFKIQNLRLSKRIHVVFRLYFILLCSFSSIARKWSLQPQRKRCECVLVWPPMLSVREASTVLNCCILVCMRLARLQRMAGMVWAFLSRGKSLDTHVSWLLQGEKTHALMKMPILIQNNLLWLCVPATIFSVIVGMM